MTTIALMTKHSRKLATYQDIVDLPENMVGEIIDGELIVSPRPAVGHALAASVLDRALGGPFHSGSGGPGGWWILHEVELHLGRDILVPDLAGWRRSRMPKLPAPGEPFITLAPDWVCEMLSPSTARIDRVRKLRIYAREKVGYVWLVDPLSRTLEVFRLNEKGWILVGTFAEDDRVRVEPFDAIELGLESLWPAVTSR